jgi:hypothetical protein
VLAEFLEVVLPELVKTVVVVVEKSRQALVIEIGQTLGPRVK